MKKIFLSIVSSLTLIVALYGQDTISKTKTYRNEFGIDASGFVKAYFNLNSSPYSKAQISKYGSKLAKTSISSNNCFDISSVVPTKAGISNIMFESPLFISPASFDSCEM